jgi:hypothetical protein
VDNTADIYSYFINKVPNVPTVSTVPSGTLQGIPQVAFPAETVQKTGTETTDLKLIPYYAWNNRGASKMMVWLPETEELARQNYYLAPDFIETVMASHTYGGEGTYGPENVDAIIDGLIPSSSSDKSIPRWTTWPQIGISQWVEFSFNRPVDVASVGIYWYDDNGGVQIPVSWDLEYYDNGSWKSFPLKSGDTYPVHKDRFDRVNSAAPIQAEKLRVNITPKSGSAIGILELQIKEASGIIRNVTASHTFEFDDVNAIIDGKYPAGSSDTSIPRWTSWEQRGVAQWVEFTLNKETDLQSFAVYWYEDTDGVKLPQSWSLEYKKNGEWTSFPVYVTDTYSTDRNKFNMVHPGEQVLTNSIRLNVQPIANKTVGILEAVIEEVK